MALGKQSLPFLCALTVAGCSSIAEEHVTADGATSTGYDSEVEAGDDPGESASDEEDGDDLVGCDSWKQDCGSGQKCTVVLDSHGEVLETRCVALHGDASPAGDPCTSVGSGDDTCAAGAVCYYLDGAGNGTCVSLCTGSLAEPHCPEDEVGGAWGTECLALEPGCPVPICQPRCHPFDGDCDPGQVCAPRSRAFVCEPDANPQKFEEGHVCAEHGDCGAGLACVSSSSAPCGEGTACCTRYCDIADHDPCEDALVPGLDCMPWPEFGPHTPPEYASVGICGLL